MPVRDFFRDQVEDFERFLLTPGEAVRVVQTEPETKQLFLKILSKMEDTEDNPHVIVVLQEVECGSRAQFFDDLLRRLVEDNENYRDGLAEIAVALPDPPARNAESPAEAFVSYVQAVAECLPDSVGAYLVVIDVEPVEDSRGLREGVAYLAERVTTDWAKFAVFDPFESPLLAGLEEETDRLGVQAFHLPLDEIEKRVEENLQETEPRAGGPASITERREQTAFLASFKAAKKEYERAIELHRESLELAREEGAREQQATILYNLGNTQLESTDLSAAEQSYLEAVDVCLEEDMTGFLPMVLTNLGMTLQRQGRLEEAAQSFAAAREGFQLKNHRPGEAYVLDCQAQALEEARDPSAAERCWLEALSLYESIVAPAFEEMREAGVSHISRQLAGHYRRTGQKQKLRDLDERCGSEGAGNAR